MGGGDHVGTGGVDARVDREGRAVDRTLPFHDRPLVIDTDEGGRADVPEVHAERVDPEAILVLGVAHGDVSGDPLVEAEAGKEPEGRREALLARGALVHGVSLAG